MAKVDLARGSIFALILGLVFHRSPLTILWRIWTVVVNAFNGETYRTRSHVFQKRLKSEPPFANRNTPTAVITEIFMGWAQATRFHIAPRVVFAAVRASVCSIYRAHNFAMQAPARLRMSTTNATKERSYFTPTCATTPDAPIRALLSIYRYRQAAERLSDDVFTFWHRCMVAH